MVDRSRGCVSFANRHTRLPFLLSLPSQIHLDSPSRGMTENDKNAASGSSQHLDAVLKRRRPSVIEVVDAKSAVDLATAQSYSETVFLFVPNLIGEYTVTPPAQPLSYIVSFIVVSRGPLAFLDFLVF